MVYKNVKNILSKLSCDNVLNETCEIGCGSRAIIKGKKEEEETLQI